MPLGEVPQALGLVTVALANDDGLSERIARLQGVIAKPVRVLKLLAGVVNAPLQQKD